MARRITGLPNGQHLAVLDPAGTLDDELARAAAHWRTVGTHTDGSLARLLETTAASTRRLHAQGVTSFTEVSPAHAPLWDTSSPVADACDDPVDDDGHRRPCTATRERSADLDQNYGCGEAS